MLSKSISTLVFGCIGALALSVPGASAAAYPDKPIHMIVPFAPGGTADIIGRLFASQLGKELGQSIVVENKPGAGGSIGARFVADSAPDGYTLLLSSSSTQGSNAAVYKKLTYDPVDDFTPITLIETVPGVLSVTKSFPAGDMAGLIKELKAKPDAYSYASSGKGGLGNLAMELFKSIAGVNIMHVPYKGAGPAFTDVISGQVQMIWEPITAELPFIRNGQLKPIAIAARERSGELPDVPTFEEAGIANYNAQAWNGLLGPKNMPAGVVKKLHEASVQALKDPDMARKLAQLGGTVVASTPEQFRKVIVDDIAKWKRVAADSNIQLD
ncbi:Bug family tripartite tricarboxylate transporter substrate binding protein [Candidimonas nitroreducens]|nr:tripartite tricarboxylate transporter substrate binding protein [Candidimonas nitroreducens]